MSDILTLPCHLPMVIVFLTVDDLKNIANDSCHLNFRHLMVDGD